MKTKKLSVTKLHKKLWPLVSQYIRLKAASEGQEVCFTCGIQKPWKELQAGHFVSRRFKSTLYEEMNLKPQCLNCNVFLHGNLLVYRRKLDALYGPEAVENLEQRAHQTKKWTTFDLLELIEIYTAKVKELSNL